MGFYFITTYLEVKWAGMYGFPGGRSANESYSRKVGRREVNGRSEKEMEVARANYDPLDIKKR